LAAFVELGSGEFVAEVLTIHQRVNLNFGGDSRRQSSLGTFASAAETTQSAGVLGHIYCTRVSNWFFCEEQQKLLK
jgi:hypothetical protein